MDKKELVKLFLSYGAQLDQDALELLNADPRPVDDMLKLGKLPPVITLEFLKSVPKGESQPTSKASVNELSRIISYRYNYLRGILMENPELDNLISMNKINEKLKEFSVIGIVFENNDKVILEDNTGSDTFSIDEQQSKYVVKDEVVGLVCERNNGINKVKKLVYPDIPLKKETTKSDAPKMIFFISDLHLRDSKPDKTRYRNLSNWIADNKDVEIFILGESASNKNDVTSFLPSLPNTTHYYDENIISSSPVPLTINNVKILLLPGSVVKQYIDRWGISPSIVLTNLLKKRNFNPILTPQQYDNSFLLEAIPDIIVVSGLVQPSETNYKGTTVLTTGDINAAPTYWMINLQTRETFKTDFS